MRVIRFHYIFFLIVFTIANICMSQSGLEQAQAAYQDGNYAEAVQGYRQVLEEHPANASAWFRLGSAYHALENYGNAIGAFQKADSLGFYPQCVNYNMACAFALSGKPDSAISRLHKATEHGYANAEHLESDSDLESVWIHPEYMKVVEQANRNAQPCEYDSTYRQLDFWIGQWEVYNPRGQLVGHNLIEKSLNGCMLIENWEGVDGSKGKSINFYDPEAGKWKQQWVGATGYIIQYSGNIIDGAMHFAGTNISMDGESKLSRMTLTPEDNSNVHQVIEQSPDGGETWNIWFDGTYIPVETSR